MAKKKIDFTGLSIEEIGEILKEGVRIRSYEGADIMSDQRYKGQWAVLPNSMWSNVFAQEGLEFYYGEDGRIYTNEIIYLDFDEKLRTDEQKRTRTIEFVKRDIEELKEQLKAIAENPNEFTDELIRDCIKKINKKISYLNWLERTPIENIIVEEELSVKELRKKMYLEGFQQERTEGSKTYIDTYRVTFQNSSKSRLGKTIWIKDTIIKKGKKKPIRENMVAKIESRMSMGITDKLTEKDEIDFVSLEAYTALSQSAITNGYIKIDPDTILVVKDFEQPITFNAVSVGKDLVPEHINDYVGKNVLWDGEMIGDSSLFVGLDNYDMVLLRQCYFKSAMFRAELVDYIKDYCNRVGLSYKTGIVRDMFGNEMRIKDIRAITTDNSMKWLKFSNLMFDTDKEMYEHWKNIVSTEWDSLFAVVKHDCGTKYGDLVKLSYQMTNSLVLSDDKGEAINELKGIVEPTENYIKELATNIETFKSCISKVHKDDERANMYLKLLEYQPDFEGTKELQEYRREIIKSIKKKAMAGQILLNGNNLTMCGNPVELVQYALTGTFESSFGAKDIGAVKCYTSKFEIGNEMVGCRSPHNYKSGLVLFKNTENAELQKLMPNLRKNIIIVDGLQYPLQDSLNGCDYDSDFICCNNDKNFVELVKKYTWGQTPIPVNNIPQEKVKYHYSIEDKWKANCSTKNSYIGQITNLAQIAVSQVSELKLNKDKYDNAEQRIRQLEDIIIVLVVLSNVAIDNAKRVYDCDLGDYLRKCRKQDCWIKEGDKIVKPEFFKEVSKNENSEFKIMDCNIDMLEVKAYKGYERRVNLLTLLERPTGKYNDRQENAILQLLESANREIRKERMKIEAINDKDIEDEYYQVVLDIKADLSRAINKKNINENTFIDMVRKCFKDKKWSGNRALLLDILVEYRNKNGELMIQKCLKK